MEKHLLTITIRTRVEPEHVVKALSDAVNMKAALWLLGPRGSRRRLQGHQQVNQWRPDQYQEAARRGLLYLEPEASEAWAFCPDLDATTGLPLLLEAYDLAFAKRSPEGPQAKEPEAAQSPTA